ncbi:MAG: hypothetical protein C0404_04585 [Verrucomicrobia bacterium]|nr:hypothetical protein [Verrucomicrobiota bacterium]
MARRRLEDGESYVAGGVALNAAMNAARISRDIDLFHDTAEAVQTAWEADRRAFASAGFDVKAARQTEGFIEAMVSRGSETVMVQWTRDSAYRFFPLVMDEELGLVLHPFDLAVNKALALVGRLEVRDWIDIINSHDRIQNLGYLFWAACGKDPGYSPTLLVAEAGRSSHYSKEEVDALSFAGAAPDARALSCIWRDMLREAAEIVDLLPPEHVGTCVMDENGFLLKLGKTGLEEAMRLSRVRFHAGSLRGSLPRFVLARR